MSDQKMDMKEINEAITSIEFHTRLYRKKRITTEEYQKAVTQQLLRLDSTRNYQEYLRNMGQDSLPAR